MDYEFNGIEIRMRRKYQIAKRLHELKKDVDIGGSTYSVKTICRQVFIVCDRFDFLRPTLREVVSMWRWMDKNRKNIRNNGT